MPYEKILIQKYWEENVHNNNYIHLIFGEKIENNFNVRKEKEKFYIHIRIQKFKLGYL